MKHNFEITQLLTPYLLSNGVSVASYSSPDEQSEGYALLDSLKCVACIKTYDALEIFINNNGVTDASMHLLNSVGRLFGLGDFIRNDDTSIAYVPSNTVNSKYAIGSAREYQVKAGDSCHLMFELNNEVEMLDPLSGFDFENALKELRSGLRQMHDLKRTAA